MDRGSGRLWLARAAVERARRADSPRGTDCGSPARPWSDYVELYWGQRSQPYVPPVSRDEICIVVVAEQAEKADFERVLADMPKHREYLADAKVSGRERGAITAMRTLRHVSGGNVALVGDASGSMDAITERD